MKEELWENLELFKSWVVEFDKKCDSLAKTVWEKSGFVCWGPIVCFVILVFFGFETVKSQSPYAAAIFAAAILVALKLRKASSYISKKSSLISRLKKIIFNCVVSSPPLRKYRRGIVEINEKLSGVKRFISGFFLILGMLSLLMALISGVIGLTSFNDILRDYLLSPLEFGGLLFIYLLFEESIDIEVAIPNGSKVNVTTDGETLSASVEANGLSGSITSTEDKTKMEFTDDDGDNIAAEADNDVKINVNVNDNSDKTP